MCGHTLSSLAEPYYCETHDIYVCEDHWNDYHDHETLDAEDDEYDDGYASDEHPPVIGYGREAHLDLMYERFEPDALARGRRHAAVELEVEYIASGSNDALDLDSMCGITGDGSLHNGIEVTTPPTHGKKLVEVITDACTKLVDAGYGVRESCGMHTHIDLRDKVDDKQFLSHLFNALYTFEDVLYAMQSGHGRHRNSYSIPLRSEYEFFSMYGQKSGDFDYNFYKIRKDVSGKRIMASEKQHKYAGVRYAAFNFHSVYYRGSLECRINEGCVTATDALMWIDVLQSIIARVEKGHSYKFMRKWVAEPVTKEKVKAFSRYFGLNAAQRIYVENRIKGGQGFGFALPYDIKWGIAKRGRPTKEPTEYTRMPFVGSRVACFNCDAVFILNRRDRMCPHCLRSLVNAYGDLNYRRSRRPLGIPEYENTFIPSFEIDFANAASSMAEVSSNMTDINDLFSDISIAFDNLP
jgi:hypothetical protein